MLHAEWLAELLEHGLLPGSFVPPEAIRQARDLTRYRKRLVQSWAAELQRVEKTLEDAPFTELPRGRSQDARRFLHGRHAPPTGEGARASSTASLASSVSPVASRSVATILGCSRRYQSSKASKPALLVSAVRHAPGAAEGLVTTTTSHQGRKVPGRRRHNTPGSRAQRSRRLLGSKGCWGQGGASLLPLLPLATALNSRTASQTSSISSSMSWGTSGIGELRFVMGMPTTGHTQSGLFERGSSDDILGNYGRRSPELTSTRNRIGNLAAQGSTSGPT